MFILLRFGLARIKNLIQILTQRVEGISMFRFNSSLLISAVLLTSCVTASSTPSIFYKSQIEADAALAAFDKAHPQCQIWTNWQRLCSRVDGTGNVQCHEDQSNRVRPSHPFCVSNKYGNPIGIEADLTSKIDVPSMHRFCSKFSKQGGVRVCSEMSPHRPFSGRNLGTLRTPFCEVWSKGERAICSEDGSVEGIPKCAELSIPKQNDGPFYCSKKREITSDTGGCTKIADSTDVFDKRAKFVGDGEVFQERHLPKRESIVSSVYCGEFRKVN